MDPFNCANEPMPIVHLEEHLHKSGGVTEPKQPALPFTLTHAVPAALPGVPELLATHACQ